MTWLQILSQHKSQSFSNDGRDYVKGVPSGALPILKCSTSNNQCRKMCLNYSWRMQLSFPRLFPIWNPPSLPVSTRCVWWRQPMDDTGQQTTEAYWPTRAKGDVLSFKPPICCPLLACSAFLLSVCYFYPCISVSTLHPSHLLFTSLAQINHKSEQVNPQQHQQTISTQQRPPTS